MALQALASYLLANRKRNKKQSRNQRRSNNVFSLSRRTIPPTIPTNITFSHTYRMRKSTAMDGVVTIRDLLLMSGCVANTTTSALSIYSSIKLNYIEVWAMASAGVPSYITLTWLQNTDFGDSTKEISDSSLSSAYPSHILVRPPTSTAQSMWQSGKINHQMFKIVASTTVLIDVNVTLILSDGVSTSGSIASSGLTVGTIYYTPFLSSLMVGLTDI